MERRVRGNPHARCEPGEKEPGWVMPSEYPYLSVFENTHRIRIRYS